MADITSFEDACQAAERAISILVMSMIDNATLSKVSHRWTLLIHDFVVKGQWYWLQLLDRMSDFQADIRKTIDGIKMDSLEDNQGVSLWDNSITVEKVVIWP